MSLRERRDILDLADGASEGVLITLAVAAGSSYRRPGARLLALPDGRTAGTISGGCLEADLLRKARWHIREGVALHRYDTGFDDDAEIPFGLGCGGVVDLLLEPLRAPDGQAVLDAMQATLTGEARSIVTQLPRHPLGFARIVLDEAGDVLYATDALPTERIVALRDHARGGDRVTSEDLFLEHLPAAQRLILCGAGEDAKPVANFAAALGWTVVIADGRGQHARADRFPQADAIRVTRSLAPLHPARADAVVVMTHSFEQDRSFLTELLSMPVADRPRYIGLLGARQRSALLLHQAAAATGCSLAEAISRVYAPIGLELGGEGPESIALAVVAQAQAAISAVSPGQAAVGARGMSAADAARWVERLQSTPTRSPWCALDAAPPSDCRTGADTVVSGSPPLHHVTEEAVR